jgi:hypothetical protein
VPCLLACGHTLPLPIVELLFYYYYCYEESSCSTTMPVLAGKVQWHAALALARAVRADAVLGITAAPGLHRVR